ncbi:MAG: patatin family protein, partial [Gorillibacterium sp.]|nr:patatin family protein [Gorillibacterium sp.]
MASLILEGGTFRPIFSAGIMDALLEEELMFPYCIGVSAGISNGFSYISKQKRRNLDIAEKFRNDNRYIGYRNFLRHRSLFGLDFIFGEIPQKLVPFNLEAFQSYTG